MKRLICMAVCALLLAALCGTAQAEETEPEKLTCGDYEYILLEDGTAEIVDYDGYEKRVVVPDTLDGHTVTSIGEYVFGWMTGTESVIVPDTVKNLEYNSARMIILPDHPYLAVIDKVLFSKPDKRMISYLEESEATSYQIPDGVQIIGDNAFRYGSNLISVKIPDSVIKIGNCAFTGCYNLLSVSIPHSVVSIGNSAFAGCSGLKTVTIYEGLTSIGGSAFAGCCEMTSLVLPGTLTTIGPNAFSGCYKLKTITIPDSVTEIGENAFEDCYDLVFTVERDSYAAQYCYQNGFYFQYPDSMDWLKK